MRQAGHTINSTPLIHEPPELRTKYSHSIVSDDHDLHIPLSLDGTTSKFHVRMPTQAEVLDVNQEHVVHVHMTFEAEWDPQSDTFHDHEASLRAALEYPPRSRGRSIYASVREPDDMAADLFDDLDDPISVTDIDHFQESAKRQVKSHGVIDVDTFALSLSREIAAARTVKRRKGFVDHRTLAQRWKIGEDTAKRSLERTTQLAVRDFTDATKSRRLKPCTLQLRYPRLNTTLYSDVLVGRCTSLLGNKYATVFCDENHWTFVDPIKSRSEVDESLTRLFQRYGIPKTIVPDNAKELTEGAFKKKCGRAGVAVHPIEAHTPNMNLCETGIREMLRGYKRKMRETDTPACLWDVCMQNHSEVRRCAALNLRGLRGDVPEAIITGQTPDISHLAEHGWYDFVWYSIPQDESKQTLKLGRYCGASHDVGEAMCSRVLNENAYLHSKTSVWPLTDAELNSEEVQAQKQKFTSKLEESLKKRGKDFKPIPDEDDDEDLYRTQEPTYPEAYEPILDDDKKEEPLMEADDLTDTQCKTFDKCISAKVMVPRGDTLAFGTVV